MRAPFVALIGILLALAACESRTGVPTEPFSSPTGIPTTIIQATSIPPALAPTTALTSAPAAGGVTPPQPAPTTSSEFALPTPDCRGGLTPAQTEGPYYKGNTPERASLVEPGMTGTRILVTGHVLTRDCKPVAGAWLDFWQADDKGVYDNAGYRLRGHQFADANGLYALNTILPGLYTGRTRHIHVKVRAPNQPILTSQLYFPEEKQNTTDGIFNAKLLVTWLNAPTGNVALYNFVLDVK